MTFEKLVSILKNNGVVGASTLKVENIELFDTVWKMVEDFNKENKQ
mgnify:CR=1 FL=1